MVDRTDIARISALYAERGTLDEAKGYLEEGGRIVGMLIGFEVPIPGSPPPAIRPYSGNVMIMTHGWTYPPQMEESIKQQLQARKDAIDRELTELGVTG